MTDHQPHGTPPSPFDPFLLPFLAEIDALTDGFAPTSHRSSVAESLDWPAAFVEALFTSARTRGLVEPAWTRRGRGRSRWRMSAKGKAWLAAHHQSDELVGESQEYPAATDTTAVDADA